MAGIYVHVPFCHAKCAYCDFYSIANNKLVNAYIDAVESEYSFRINELGNEHIDTLYLGGGTPSMLDAGQFRSLVSFLPRHQAQEFTIEANPEDITLSKVETWMAEGVNRVSIGVQSLVDDELRAVKRRHSAAQALEAIDNIRKAGIDNISADLIYGLPGQTLQSWNYSLNKLFASGICHLSAYCLSFEEGTLLYRRLQQGQIEETSDEEIELRYALLCRTAAKNGFRHYEISNFALSGRCSRHNSNYWKSIPYLGLGPAAHSLGTDGLRRFNTADIRQYIEDPTKAATIDEEDEANRLNDTIMTALRTAEGLNRNDVTEKQWDGVMVRGRKWLRAGALCTGNDDSRLFIPEDKWLVADAIIRDLFTD